MTYAEVEAQAKQLSLKEQTLLIEAIMRYWREEALAKEEQRLRETPLVTDDEFSADHLSGILKPDGLIPTDAEIREDYFNYLEQKYA